jgi:hypothetical protein
VRPSSLAPRVVLGAPPGRSRRCVSVRARRRRSRLRAARQVLLLLLRGVPNSLSGWGTPDRLLAAERSAVSCPSDAGDEADRVGVARLAEAEAAVLLGILIPNAPRSRSPWITSAGPFRPDRSCRCPPARAGRPRAVP